MNRIFTRLGFTAVAIIAGSGIVAHAQTVTTGGVTGIITDAKGAPVSGAMIRMTSAQTTRTFTTGADGSYRVGLLNPGSYVIEVTKGGFQKITQTISVLVNQTQPVNFKMASEAATVVEVVGTQTTVDPTSTQVGLTTTADTLSSIPIGRDMNGIANLAPGVVASGFGDPSISGASGAENSYVLDGLTTTDFRRGFQGATVVTDFIEQVEVQTGGFKPEFSALGGVFNAVTKSGSNANKGSAWVNVDARSLQAVPKKTKYGSQAPPNDRYDLGVEVGGPIMKDKLFYWAGLNVTSTKQQASDEALINNNLKKSDPVKQDDLQFLGKLNYYITQDQQVYFTANVNNTKTDQAILYPLNGTANFGGSTKDKTTNLSAGYDWTISPALFFSLKFGTTDYKTTFDPTAAGVTLVQDQMYFDNGPGTLPGGNPAGVAYNTFFNTGGPGLYVPLDQNKTTQYRADLSWFLGAHNLKFGVSFLTSKYTEQARTSGAGYRVRGLNAGDPTLVGTGDNFLRLERQYNSTDATVKAEYTAFYAQDSWEIASGFRAFYGLRYEIQDQKDLDGKSFMKFSNFKDQAQPRLGFTWDVNNDGRSKVSGSYAKYFEAIPQRLAMRVFANEVFLRNRFNGAYFGLFTKATYDATTGTYGGTWLTGATPDRTTDFATPFSYDPIAEGTKLPQRQEFILGYDFTFKGGLLDGFTAGIHAKHRELKNPIEDSVILDSLGNITDPGAPIRLGQSYGVSAASLYPEAAVNLYGTFGGQAILWNPGRYAKWTARNISGGTGSIYNNAVWSVSDTGYDAAKNTYDSVDFTLEKKTARDYINFSYTWSRSEGNYEGVVSSSNGQADGNITASFDYAAYSGYGLLPLDRTHQIKLFASHKFDVAGNELSLGMNWTFLSGTPLSLLDDGSTTNGFAPGYDTNNSYFHTSDPNGDGIPFDGFWVATQYDAVTGAPLDAGRHPYLDLGGYGNAIFANGVQGDRGRTPSINNVDIHIDYAIKFGKGMKLVPSVDLFNLFNTRYATAITQQGTTSSGTANPSYAQATNWQVGRRYRFGVKFQF